MRETQREGRETKTERERKKLRERHREGGETETETERGKSGRNTV